MHKILLAIVIAAIATLISLPSLAAEHPIAPCERLLLPLPREARTEDFREGRDLDVAMLGDSLIRDFHIDSYSSIMKQLWFRNQRNPFLNTDPTNGIESFFQLVAQSRPLRAREYARAGATVVLKRPVKERVADLLLNIRTLDEQVGAILAQPQLPDLMMLWIGHNNLDFVRRAPERATEIELDALATRIRAEFVEAYRHSLLRLIAAARKKPGRTAIVVYGLVNSRDAAIARAAAGARRAEQAAQYPYFKRSEERFPSIAAKHRDRLARLAADASVDLATLVAELRAAMPRDLERLDLSYSDAIHTLEFKDADLLHPIDAWHTSTAGKNRLARALFEGAQPALRFLDGPK